MVSEGVCVALPLPSVLVWVLSRPRRRERERFRNFFISEHASELQVMIKVEERGIFRVTDPRLSFLPCSAATYRRFWCLCKAMVGACRAIRIFINPSEF
jgi:hypothetical protein